MLILTRKIDQGIVISGNIIVRVLGVDRDRVKIGIAAPSDVIVLRQELVERDQRAKAEQEGPGTNANDPAPSVTEHEETPATG